MCILSDVERNCIIYVYLLQSATVTATVATYALSTISVVYILNGTVRYYNTNNMYYTITRGKTAAAIYTVTTHWLPYSNTVLVTSTIYTKPVTRVLALLVHDVMTVCIIIHIIA